MNMNPFHSSESSDRSSNSPMSFLQSPFDWIGEMKSDSSSKQTGGLKLPLVGELPVPQLELPIPPLPGFNSGFPTLPGFGDSSSGSDSGLPGLNGKLPMPNELSGLSLPGFDKGDSSSGLGLNLGLNLDLPSLPGLPGSDTARGITQGLPALQLFDGLLSEGGLRSQPRGLGGDVWSDYEDSSIANNLNRSDWSNYPEDNAWSDYPNSYSQGSRASDSAGMRFSEPYGSSSDFANDSFNRARTASGSDALGNSDAMYSSDGKVDLRLVLQAIEPLLRSMQQLISMMSQQFMNSGSTAGGGSQPGRWSGGNSWGDSGGSGSAGDGWRYNSPGENHHCGGSDRNPADDGGDNRPHNSDTKGEPKDDKPGTKSGTNAGDGGTKKPGDDNTKPPTKTGDDSNDTGGIKDRGDDADSPNKRYADTGVERGRTLFRDDFNGKLGEEPNRKVFDTEHIGADGKTRQRGDSIQEKGIIDEKNTVMDGEGHLQLFAQKEKTWDPVAKEFVPYTKGSYHTSDGMNFKLDDHPDGVVIEVRAKHPTAPGAKFNALWIMTRDWTAKQGEKPGSTVEYDAAEGGGADIAIHWPYKDENGDTKVKHPGGFHPKDVDFEDGKFHTYTVVLTKNPETGRGDVTQYIDGKKEYSAKNIFPNDKPLHIKASMEVSPKWTGKTLTSEGGLNSDAAGIIDYVDVSELKKKGA